MKPAAFDYRRPESLDEALDLLAELGDEARVLAGGQSLVALLNMRLARPALVVDIGRLADLADVARCGPRLVIGSRVTHRAVETAAAHPDFAGYEVLPRTARLIGHLPIRTRGTFGGSVAHADPAAEWPLLARLLDAEMVLGRRGGERRVASADYFQSFLTTATEPGELLLRVELPRPPHAAALVEFAPRRGDFAVVAVAVALDLSPDGVCTSARIAVGGVDSVPLRVPEAEAALAGVRLGAGPLAEAARVAAASVDPLGDAHASPAYRRRLVAALTERAFDEAVGPWPQAA